MEFHPWTEREGWQAFGCEETASNQKPHAPACCRHLSDPSPFEFSRTPGPDPECRVDDHMIRSIGAVKDALCAFCGCGNPYDDHIVWSRGMASIMGLRVNGTSCFRGACSMHASHRIQIPPTTATQRSSDSAEHNWSQHELGTGPLIVINERGPRAVSHSVTWQ